MDSSNATSFRRYWRDCLSRSNRATFAYITGWRIDSEILSLEWRQVDFAAGEVWLDPGKTKNGNATIIADAIGDASSRTRPLGLSRSPETLFSP